MDINEIDTFNKYLVGVGAMGIIVGRAIQGPLSRADALLAAAYLVALADPTGEDFPQVLKAVQST